MEHRGFRRACRGIAGVVVALGLFLPALLPHGGMGSAAAANDGPDLTPPRLDAFTLLTTEVQAPGNWMCEIDLTEESGLRMLVFNYKYTGADGATRSYMLYQMYTAPLTTGVHTISVALGATYPEGEYVLDYISLTDTAGNNKTYYSEGDGTAQDYVTGQVLAAEGDFAVAGAPPADTTAPRLVALNAQQAPVQLPGSVGFAMEIEEEESGLTLAMLSYRVAQPDADGRTYTLRYIPGAPLKSGTHNFVLELPEDYVAGMYALTAVALMDAEGNTRMYNATADGLLRELRSDGIEVDVPHRADFTAEKEEEESYTAPVLQSFALQSNSLIAPDTWRAAAGVYTEEDELRLVMLSYKYTLTDGTERHTSFVFYPGGQDGTYDLQKAVDPSFYAAEYELEYLYLQDSSGNARTYYLDEAKEALVAVQPGMLPVAVLDVDTSLPSVAVDPVMQVYNPLQPALYIDLDDAGLIAALQAMADGTCAVLRCAGGAEVPKEVFEAVAGRGVALLLDDGMGQWLVFGTDILAPGSFTLANAPATQQGGEYGLDGETVLVLDIPDTGGLKAKIQLRTAHAALLGMLETDDVYFTRFEDGTAVAKPLQGGIEGDGYATVTITAAGRYVFSHSEPVYQPPQPPSSSSSEAESSSSSEVPSSSSSEAESTSSSEVPSSSSSEAESSSSSEVPSSSSSEAESTSSSEVPSSSSNEAESPGSSEVSSSSSSEVESPGSPGSMSLPEAAASRPGAATGDSAPLGIYTAVCLLSFAAFCTALLLRFVKRRAR